MTEILIALAAGIVIGVIGGAAWVGFAYVRTGRTNQLAPQTDREALK